LPTSVVENTYFTTIIEGSDNYGYEHVKGDYIVDKNEFTTMREIKNYLKKLDEGATEELKKRKMKMKDNDGVDTGDTELEIMFIRLPFKLPYRLIDTAGLSFNLFNSALHYLMTKHATYSYFVYVKDSTNPQAIDNITISVLRHLSLTLKNFIFTIAFTKSDKFLEIIEDSTKAIKYGANIITFLDTFFSQKGMNLKDIIFLNSKGYFNLN